MDSTHISPLDYLSMIRRRRWAWLTPLLASAVAGWLLVKFLPREYRSSTTIGVNGRARVAEPDQPDETRFDNQERIGAPSSSSCLKRADPGAVWLARKGASESQVDRRMAAAPKQHLDHGAGARCGNERNRGGP